MTPPNADRTRTRRGVLGLAALGTAAMGGCVKGAVRSADELAKGADESAEGADESAARRGASDSSGASGADDLLNTSLRTTIHDGVQDEDGDGDGDGDGDRSGATAESNRFVGPNDFDDVSVPTTWIDQDVTVERGRYRYWELFSADSSTPSAVTLSYDVIVRSGPSIDVFVLDREELGYLERGQNFEYLTAPSALDTEYTEYSGQLPERDYYIVLDNTTAGAASPGLDGAATVSIALEATDE